MVFHHGKLIEEIIYVNIGDYGEHFYIILRGKVSVLIPNYIKDLVPSKPKA
jgi:hypothetical protein